MVMNNGVKIIFFGKAVVENKNVFDCPWRLSKQLFKIKCIKNTIVDYLTSNISSYSLTLTVIVFPLGSSKRSIVWILAIMPIPKNRITTRRRLHIIPERIGMEKKLTQLLAGPK